MSNLIFNREPTLPSYEITTSVTTGEIVGVKVKRFLHSVYYHRTGRGVKEMIDSEKGELHSVFGSARAFAQFASNKIILDLGCGDGNLVSDMAKLNSPILGLDLHLSKAQEREPFFFQGDAFRMNFKSQSFDCILSSWSVFHYEPLSQLNPLMREVHRTMRVGGILVIPSMTQVERLQEINLASKKLGMVMSLMQPCDVVVCRKV